MRKFAQFDIDQKFIIYESDLSFAFTNLRPALEGHILVCPKRVVQYFHDLTNEEKIDLANTTKRVSDVMKKILNKKYLSLTIQDGPIAGQTVPHVHAHIFVKNNTSDEVYCSKDVPEDERVKNSSLYRSYFTS